MSKERVKELKGKLITKEKALELVEPYENCQEVVISGKTKFEFHPKFDGHFVVAHKDKEYTLNPDGFTKLCRLVGVPSTYVRKIPSQLLFPHLSYWLSDGDRAFKGFMRGNTDADGRQPIANIAREDAYYYPISRVFENVDKVTKDYLVEGLDDVNWRNSTFGLVFPDFEFNVEDKDIQEGDYIYGGIKIKSSLLGEFPFKLAAFLLTLACANGMVSVDEVFPYNRKYGFEGQDGWIVDGTKKCIGALKSEVEKVQALAKISASGETIVPYLSHIFDQMNVNQKSRIEILKKVNERNPRNLYQLMNAITETTHSIENRGEVFALQTLGGFVASHAESCDKCLRPY